MKTKFLFVIPNDAGFCNQAWSYAVFSKFAEQYNTRVFFGDIPAKPDRIFRQSKISFSICGSRSMLRWFLYSRVGVSLGYRLGFRGSVDFRKKYVSVIDGWNSLNYALSALENDFDVSDYVGVVDETQANLIREDRPIVVHARLGDYANYRKGRYFFGAHFYIRLANALARTEPEKKIIICTDEPAEFTKVFHLLESKKVCLSQAKSLIEDLQIMSDACWIIGPPSSFSMLASSIGKVPLSWIFSAEDSIEKLRKNRSKILGFYRFENGKVLTEGPEDSLLLESGTVPKLRTIFSVE